MREYACIGVMPYECLVVYGWYVSSTIILSNDLLLVSIDLYILLLALLHFFAFVFYNL